MDTGSGGQHAGVESVLTLGSDRYQVAWADGRALGVPTSSRVTVTGRLEVVGADEWGAYRLVDPRSDWLVTALAPADRGDTVLDVVPRADD